MQPSIHTYTGESFREKFIQPDAAENGLLKAEFGTFFVVRLEDMSGLMKVPVPPTRSTNHTLVFLTDGQATMTIASETYTVYQHRCLIVPAGQAFSFDSVDPNRGYLCNVHPEFIIDKFGGSELLNGFEFLRVWGNPCISLLPYAAHGVDWLFERVLMEYSDHGLTHPDLIQAYLIAILTEFNQVYRPMSESSQTHAITTTNRFKELLFANIKTHQLVTDYASLLNIGPNHLNKTIKAITGKSPTKWIDEAIIMEAKVLLHQTDLSINEVAAEVGVLDSSYFSRLFKKYEGRSPGAFRRMIEKS